MVQSVSRMAGPHPGYITPIWMSLFGLRRIQILNRLTANLDGMFITIRTDASFGYSPSSLQVSRPAGHQNCTQAVVIGRQKEQTQCFPFAICPRPIQEVCAL